MKNKYINFLLCGDKNFIVPITIAMTSILTNINNSRITRFFLLTTDFSDNEINTILKLKKKYNFELINIDIKNNINIFDKIDITKNKIPYVYLAAYYRLLMFKILPEYVDKCFYIDGDMIIDTDLSITYDNLTEEKLASVIIGYFRINPGFISSRIMINFWIFERCFYYFFVIKSIVKRLFIIYIAKNIIRWL